MKYNIYEYTKYKRYLADIVTSESHSQRGFRAQLCKAVGCQPSYLSQVLNGKPDFTLEQANRLNQFLMHGKNESRYFLTLVEYARAGSVDLKDFFLEQIKELQQNRLNLKKRLADTEEIPLSMQNKYYSAWFYSAIHIALAVPEFQDPKKIAEHFNLPAELVGSAIHFLEECGLVEKKEGHYEFTKKRLHLGSDSDFIQRHHINWRSQSLQSVEKNLSEDLHFSTVFAIAQQDFAKIKEILIRSVESAREVIQPSPSERVCALTVDLFKL